MKNGKKKVNKYARRRVLAIVFLIFLILIIKGIVGFKNKNKIPDLSIIFNNELLNTEKEVIVDENENIYFSKDDIQKIFDETIYYNEAEKELITTYNKHTALLKIDESSMIVNGENTDLKGKLQELKGVVYIPIIDLQNVYDIEVEFSKPNNRIIIDSTLNEKIQATAMKNINIKEKKGLFKKNVQKINIGENVIVLEKEGKYSKVRTSLGKIGYVKSKKLEKETVIREKTEDVKYNLNVYKEYSNISGIYENISVPKDKLNVVIPTFFYLGKNNKVLDKTTSKTATYANYTNWLNENELSILPTLENSESVSKSLLTYSQRNQVINDLYAYIMKYQYKGINVQFKNIDDINSFYRFIIEMTPRFKAEGLIVSVTLNSSIDKEKISKITEYIIEE